MDNRPQMNPKRVGPDKDTFLDREIAVVLRGAMKEPSADFTDLLMSRIEVEAQPQRILQPVVASRYSSARLPVYLIGLSLAFILTLLVLPISGSSSGESIVSSSSVLWTLCAVGLIAILGLTQTPRFSRILPR